MLTADKGARLGNMVVDTIIFLVLMWLVEIVLNMFADFISNEAYMVIDYLLPLCLYFVYYFLFEHLLGRTPGKYLTKTVVVARNGSKPSAIKLIIRSLLRVVPYDWFSYVFGFTGLHDKYSKTLLVYNTAKRNTSFERKPLA